MLRKCLNMLGKLPLAEVGFASLCLATPCMSSQSYAAPQESCRHAIPEDVTQTIRSYTNAVVLGETVDQKRNDVIGALDAMKKTHPEFGTDIDGVIDAMKKHDGKTLTMRPIWEAIGGFLTKYCE